MEKNLIAKCVDIVKQGDIEDRYPFEMSVYLIYDNGTCENDEMYQMSWDDMEFVTGMKSDELNKLSDIEITERKGTITIRSGKGNKYRIVPLNKESRNSCLVTVSCGFIIVRSPFHRMNNTIM